MGEFLIQLKYTNKYIVTDPNHSSHNHLVLSDDPGVNNNFVFETVEGIWGYIRHVQTDRLVHPTTETLTPETGSGLTFKKGQNAAALFALDEVNNLIVHRSGQLVGTMDSNPEPAVGSLVVFHNKQDDSVKFLFVSPWKPGIQVALYGQPKIDGSWKIVSAVMNPKAEHTTTMVYKVGRSRTTFNEDKFEFKWEASASARAFFLSAETSASVKYMVKKTTTSTWHEESEVTREIKVEPGNSVVTWQYVFSGEQHGDNTIFQSNILSDTKSPNEVPKDFDGGSSSKVSSNFANPVNTHLSDVILLYNQRGYHGCKKKILTFLINLLGPTKIVWIQDTKEKLNATYKI